MTLDDKKLDEVLKSYGIVVDPEEGWYPETVDNLKKDLNQHYMELFMEIMGGLDLRTNPEDYLAISNYKAELRASLKQRLGL